jgi:hypothetical protein
MAQAVHNPEQLRQRYEAAINRPPEDRPTAFGLLLFDERRSHQVVHDFAAGQFRWLDALARRARMILFLPVDPGTAQWAESGGDEVVLVNTHEDFQNPSLEVAGRFAIDASDLPGLLFFSNLELTDAGANTGVYWPLSLDLFEDSAQKAEEEFSELFDFVQAAHRASTEPEDLLAELERKFQALDRQRQRRPIYSAIKFGLLRIVRFPGALVESMGIAYAQETARRLAGP